MHGYLPVHGGHRIYYETHGDERAPPLVVLHGGPGGGMQPELLPLFRGWYAVVFDQRGCGRSLPFGELRHNRTPDLVADIEALREKLGIERWTVFGGSWGTTLGLAYALAHPDRVKAMIFRGTCLCDEASFRWMYERGGASEVRPEAWKAFVPSQVEGWRAVVRWYHRRIAAGGADGDRAAKAWWRWEWALSRARPDDDKDGGMTDRGARAIALLETHYFLNGCWLPNLIDEIPALSRIPLTMVHGEYDLVCPLSGAEAVREAMPHARLIVVPNAGHAAADMMPTLRRVLRDAKRALHGKHMHKTRKRTSARSTPL